MKAGEIKRRTNKELRIFRFCLQNKVELQPPGPLDLFKI